MQLLKNIIKKALGRDIFSFNDYFYPRGKFSNNIFKSSGTYFDFVEMSELTRFFHLAFEFIGSSIGQDDPCDYLEFGCNRARTFRLAQGEVLRFNLTRARFFAFDSFEGLPTDGSFAMSEESFRSMIAETGYSLQNIQTIKGFYEDSLTADQSDQLAKQNIKARLITVDCDLHDSAVSVLDFIERFIDKGTIIYMDDYFSTFLHGDGKWGTAKAFKDFEKKSRFNFEPFLTVGSWGKSFIAHLE